MRTIQSKNGLGMVLTVAVSLVGVIVCPVNGQLSLPYYGTTSTPDKAFWLGNTYSGAGASYGGFFYSAGQEGRGVFGQSDGANGYGVKGWAKYSGDAVNYGGHFCATGMRGIGVYGWAENTGDVENFGGSFLAEGLRGVGVYAKGGSQGFAGLFDGNIFITGAGNGIIFPDGTKQTTAATGSESSGAGCAPKPAYDSGWINAPSTLGSPLNRTLTHGLGGSVDDYFVDLQYRMSGWGVTNVTNKGIGNAFSYSNLTTSAITISGPASALDGSVALRVRIWTSTCSGGTGSSPK